MTAVIRTSGLTKRYGALTAVDAVDLDVNEGDLFGFLGPNGSGKSTTIRMLLGLVFPTEGHVEVLGREMPRHGREVLVEVGALVEGPGFYPTLSGRRNLSIFDAAGAGGSRRTRRARIGTVLERVGLAGIDDRPLRAYSMGMRQRLGLAAAMLRAPRLLVLDEPTNGLDPQGIHEMRTLFAELVAEGTTVFLSSHLLSEVEVLCTRAAMMAQGRLVAQDRIERLLAPTGRLVIDSPDVDLAAQVLARFAGHIERTGHRLVVQLNGAPPEDVNRALVEAGARVRGLVIERRTLEDAYLGLTGSSGDARPQPLAAEPGGCDAPG
jgi:ABC-2 type transport system ATP-binding protein